MPGSQGWDKWEAVSLACHLPPQITQEFSSFYAEISSLCVGTEGKMVASCSVLDPKLVEDGKQRWRLVSALIGTGCVSQPCAHTPYFVPSLLM